MNPLFPTGWHCVGRAPRAKRRAPRAALWAVAACLAAAAPGGARTIYWSNDPDMDNRTSTGGAMDAGFRFELGVFDAGFTPTAANVAEWHARWTAAQRAPYNPDHGYFTAKHVVTSNTEPFAAGTQAYIWGFRGDALSGEWILLAAPAWLWPQADPMAFPLEWFVKDADTCVLGTVVDGNMTSAAVAGARPPDTNWTQWQAAELAGEPLDGPADDPDRDGTDNLLEFVFGTPPTRPGPPPQMPATLAGGFLQVTIPRRIDHPALLTVEVSSDLTEWDAGPEATVVVADDLAALVVRDLTPLGAGAPRRFMRLRADLPAPPAPQGAPTSRRLLRR